MANGSREISADEGKQGVRLALERGDLQRADKRCRAQLERFPADPDFQLLLAELAVRIGRMKSARAALNKAEALGGASSPALRAAVEPVDQAPPAGPRYLLITEWGHGFWSDVAHVLGSLLLAEMTNRIPLVHWGDNSLFSPSDGANAWTRYLEPVSGANLSELAAPGHSYFPPPWNAAATQSARGEPVRTERPRDSYGLGLLPRTESVVVSDTWVGVSDLIPWLEPGDPLHGKSRIEVTRYLVEKYLHLRPNIRTGIDAFAAQVLAKSKCLGVHIRASDKVAEVKDLADVNAQYIPWVEAFLADKPDWRIFLLTDSQSTLQTFLSRFPGRIIATASHRTDGRFGIHYSGHDPVEVAQQVIIDTYLATRCDAFVGNGASNVSLAVEYLRDWPDGTYALLGPDWRGIRFSL
jgi:hypothetical protein